MIYAATQVSIPELGFAIIFGTMTREGVSLACSWLNVYVASRRPVHRSLQELDERFVVM